MKLKQNDFAIFYETQVQLKLESWLELNLGVNRPSSTRVYGFKVSAQLLFIMQVLSTKAL